MPSAHSRARALLFACLGLAACFAGAHPAVAGPRLVAPQIAAPGSCARPDAPPPGVDQPLPDRDLDLALLDEALRQAASAARCRAGLSSLSPDPRLKDVARTHAEAMAGAGRISHGGDGVFPDFQTRLRQGQVRFRSAGENLFQHPRLTLEQGREYMIVDVASCRYADLVTGAAPSPHTYRSLADALVAGWLKSEGHRRNLLNPEHRRAGAAAAVRSVENSCGDVYAAQLYAN